MNNAIHTYKQVRVCLADTGELLLALPIYADQKGAIFNEKEMKTLTDLSVNLGIYEKLGYIMYHPSQPFSFYMNSLELFTDLGEL